MLNSILETRKRVDELYDITLQMDAQNYLSIYETLNTEDAIELLRQYLLYRGDDGRPGDVTIKLDRNAHLVTIEAKLHYEDNEKTEYPYQLRDYISNPPPSSL